MENSTEISSNVQLTEEEIKISVRKFISKAKAFASEGELYESLKYFKKAYKLTPTEKIQSRIVKIKAAIEEDEEDDCDFVELDNGLVIYKKLVERLYPHQIEGIKWFYDIYQSKKKGGILADDMGLGKTIQVIAYISAMFDMQLVKNILLVLPLSVIPTWLKEFKDWAPGIKIDCFHGPASKRLGILRQCMMKRSVCITTYGLIITQWQTLGETVHGREFVWDYIILDEGHRIKRPSKTTKRLHSIPSKNRIILTGTPIQNRVRDLWALMDWVTQGSLLGTQKTFKSSYEIPIERARQREATAPEIQLGNHMADSLRKLTQPYILRRTKEELMMEDKENLGELGNVVDSGQDKSVMKHQVSFPKLSTKTDFVVWVYLSAMQEKIYRDFIQLESVKALLASHRSPLVYLTILKKICDHPRLLSTKACLELGLQFNDGSFADELQSQEAEECAANRIDNISDEILIEESAKLGFLIDLLLRLREEGHRTLVFSMSRKMLNIIQRILINKRFKIMRLDGLVTKLKERERRVNLFQEDSSYNVFLLTTQVGGVGLTLTGADRVVIYDPSWNPASDAQSVDRIYRIGQKKSVVVYRLISCGTVEEKIYRRQIFKNSFIQQSTCGSKDPYRYFSRQDLAELFILDDVKSSATQIQLQKLHGHQKELEADLKTHVEYLHTLQMFGLSNHDLMFSKKPDDFDYDTEMAASDFNNKVEEAQNRLKIESNQFTGLNETEQRWGAIAQDTRQRDPSKSDRNEPVFPIEGLSQQMDALSLPEQFSARRNSESSDSVGEFDREIDSESDESSSAGGESEHSDDLLRSDLLNRAAIDQSSLKVEETSSNNHSPTKSGDTSSALDQTKADSSSSHFNQSQGKEKMTSSTFDQSFKKSEEKVQKTRRRLPSFDDDDVILVAESPQLNPDPPGRSKIASSFSTKELTSDDELILAFDSPVVPPPPSVQSTDIDKSKEFPTEIEDSFTAFSESDNDSDELEESWMKAFSVQTPVAESIQPLDQSRDDTPIVPSNRRRKQVIESDDSSDEENLLQLHKGSTTLDPPAASQPHSSRGNSLQLSNNATERFSISPTSWADDIWDKSDVSSSDGTESYDLNPSVNSKYSDVEERSKQDDTPNPANRDGSNNRFTLSLSDFEDDEF